VARQLKRYFHEVMLDCTRLHTNAPDSFITWAAFSVIGGIMKRKFFINEGVYTIYPNQYIVLVAPPAVGKGTAINFNWKIVKDSAPNYIANMIPDRVTGPRILERIAQGWNSAPQIVGGQIKQGTTDHTCTIFSTELSVLLGASEQMIDFLCEWWDRTDGFEYDTKNSGSAFVKDNCISLAGCTTPDFIRHIDRNRNMTIKGGFTSRCIFVYEDKPARYLLHPPPIAANPQSKALLDQLKNDAQHIASLLGGEFTYSAGALIRFDDFMKNAMINNQDDSEAVMHFKGRMGVHISKLAMVLAISREDTLVISEGDMINAIHFVNKSLKTLEKVFRGSGDSNLAEATGHVQSYLEKNGGATRRELLRNLYRHMDADTLDRILYVLAEIGYCRKQTQGTMPMWIVNTNGHVNGNGARAIAQPLANGIKKP
jgi:Protein of unknown function (DUF3987)